MWKRREWLGAAGALGAAGTALPAWSQFRVEISGIGATQLPIALLRFKGDEAAPTAVSAIVRADLERSGHFRFVDTPLAIDETGVPGYADLRTRGADALVAGSLGKLADGRFDVRYKLWDVVKGARSEERRVGKECRRLCRSRWSPYH
jgi:TolB protein